MNDLTNTFKSCLNILRDNEGLTGEKALRTMNQLIILKMLEPQFESCGSIDIDNHDYDFSHIEDDNVEYHKNKLLYIARFSNLAKEKEENVPVNMKYLWDDILSKHPSTKNIFIENKGFDIKHQSTYNKLIKKLASLDLKSTPFDVLGNAYEEVIKDVLVGKVLGQFFTQPIVKKMMVKLIDPKIHPDGTIDSCCDPTMGTGGFLISYLNTILKQATEKNIVPDWDFIKTQGLYGKEIEPDTYQLAVSNMLISSGHMFNVLDCGDSIRAPIIRKFDNILSNPPFGIKGLNYDEFRSSIKNAYTPIKTDNAVSLFIQAIIYMLKIGGKCAIVLPDGQDLFSKTNATLVAIREYLLKTCDLKEVIYLPSGIFTHTSINTCIYFFIKKVEGTEVLKTTVKMTKKGDKITGYKYEFSKKLQTTEVAFYNYNSTTDEKTLLATVPIDDIVTNSYSLNYGEYIKNDSVTYDDNVVVKTLGELFDITKGSLQSSKNTEGEFAFITAADTNKTHNSYTHDCECVMLVGGAEGSLAKAQYFDGKFIASDLLYILISKQTEKINYKYVWYYLNYNREMHLQDSTICCGTPKLMISKDRCSKIKIPFPSIERQEKIVEYLDFIYDTSNKASTDKIANLKKANEYAMSNQINFGKNEVKTLGEVCNFIKSGKIKPSDNKNGTLYPYYGTGSITGYTDDYLYDGKYILTARNGTIGNCFLTDGKFFPSDHVFVIDIEDKILMKYVYYILLKNENLDQLKTGIGIPNITKSILKNLEIHIPSLERQKELVKYCEGNDKLIAELEKEIERNVKEASAMLNLIG